MRRKDRYHDEARTRLQDNIRRASGFMESIVKEARRLEVEIPPALVVSVELWQHWHRSLASRRPPEGE
jgi:hypothetical protein